ncbi:MAG: hypothetical protein HFE85_00595 [Clostridiales bacterium]|nr:hypothetical protein [Clostridiales bacterium]
MKQRLYKAFLLCIPILLILCSCDSSSHGLLTVRDFYTRFLPYSSEPVDISESNSRYITVIRHPVEKFTNGTWSRFRFGGTLEELEQKSLSYPVNGDETCEFRHYENGVMLAVVRRGDTVLTAATVMEYHRNGTPPGNAETYPYILFDSSIAVTDNSSEAETSPQILFPFGLVSDKRLLAAQEYGYTISPETEYWTDYSLSDFAEFYREMIQYHPDHLSDDDLEIQDHVLTLGKRFIRPEGSASAIQFTFTENKAEDGAMFQVSIIK